MTAEAATEPVEAPAEVPTYELTRADSCDACGPHVAAYMRVTFKTGELFFCSHHARVLEPLYALTAVDVHDETQRLHDEEAAKKAYVPAPEPAKTSKRK